MTFCLKIEVLGLLAPTGNSKLSRITAISKQVAREGILSIPPHNRRVGSLYFLSMHFWSRGNITTIQIDASMKFLTSVQHDLLSHSVLLGVYASCHGLGSRLRVYHSATYKSRVPNTSGSSVESHFVFHSK